MNLSLRRINSILKARGDKPIQRKDMFRPIKLIPREIQQIEKLLENWDLVVIRRYKSGKGFEFVNPRFVTLAPRFNFERVAANMKAERAGSLKPSEDPPPIPDLL